MSRTRRAVIVGASIAGLTTAEVLREEGFDGEIVIVGEEAQLPYTRPPLSKQILLGEWEPEDARIRTRAELDGLGIQLLTGVSAAGLDVAGRTIHTSVGPIAYDDLIIATGTRPRTHPLLPHSPSLRTIDDAILLRAQLRLARRVAVIGSGILGSEIASASRKHGAETVIVGRSGTLSFGGVGSLLSDRLAHLHKVNDVELALHADVISASPSSGGTELVLRGSAERSFDLVVVMIGGTPCTEWLAGSGLDIADGVACDDVGVAAPGVSAVGDVAAWHDPSTGRGVRTEHQSNAIEQAIAVASRIARNGEIERPVPLFWSEIHGTQIKAVGWFDQRRQLVDTSVDPTTDRSILCARAQDGTLRGAVAWNAPPREFQSARAEIITSARTAIQPIPKEDRR